ncbi:uncharacterized protein [Musca autumnalis]|uniref:uncharacterized protein n=1 Tax=Musca autumnalis TaxID=221902 RepID=UPI003CF7A1B1
MQFFTFVLFVTLLAVGHCSPARGVFSDPAHPDKCDFKDFVLFPGEKQQPKGRCVQYFCKDSSGFGMNACVVREVMEPCKYGDYIDPEGPYPNCCERKVVCP